MLQRLLQRLRKRNDENMIMIAGLGNPGKEYEHTRHNVGFDVLDRIAEKPGVGSFGTKLRAKVGTGVWQGEKILLVKPQTYMNLSGESIGALAAYYRIEPEHIIVISDDVALPLGSIRVRKKGSAGGHNGLKNIIQCLGTDTFARVRVGVGDCGKGDLVGHVLGRPGGEDRKVLEEAMDLARDAALCIVSQGPDEAMNLYNRKGGSQNESTASAP